MKFYLSGGMEYKKKLGAKWRDWLTEQLEELRHDAINPVKLENASDTEDRDKGFPLQTKLSMLKAEGKLNEVRKIVRDSLFRKDMWAIQLADAIVVLYDESAQKGAGTLSEAWEAFREGEHALSKIITKKISTNNSNIMVQSNPRRRISSEAKVDAKGD
jgi:hypothetical protein